jgi:hypothetical protein
MHYFYNHKKVIYFTDESAAQYKNRKILSKSTAKNMLFSAEWHFFKKPWKGNSRWNRRENGNASQERAYSKLIQTHLNYSITTAAGYKHDILFIQEKHVLNDNIKILVYLDTTIAVLET